MHYLENYGITQGKGQYYEEAIYGLGLVYNLISDEISTYLGDFGLTPAKLNVLMFIKHQGGKTGISQVEISKKLIVTPSNMTRVLDKLGKEKLIERLAHDGDRRVNLIRVTDKASKLLDAAWPGYKEKLRNLMSGVKQDDQKALAQLIVKWLDTMIAK